MISAKITKDSERGGVLVFFLFLVTAAIICAGVLVVDIGRLILLRQQLQATADSAALAGVAMLAAGSEDSDGSAYLPKLPSGLLPVIEPDRSNYIRAVEQYCRLFSINQTFEENSASFADQSSTDTFADWNGWSTLMNGRQAELLKERGAGWFEVKPAVLAAIASSDLVRKPIFLSEVDRSALLSKQIGASVGAGIQSLDPPGFTTQTMKANNGNFEITVQRGYQCRGSVRDCRNPDPAILPCLRQFISLETGDPTFSQQRGIHANTVQVTLRVNNIVTIFSRLIGIASVDQVSVTATASLHDLDVNNRVVCEDNPVEDTCLTIAPRIEAQRCCRIPPLPPQSCCNYWHCPL